MHDIKFILGNLDYAKSCLKKRNAGTEIIDKVVKLNDERKEGTHFVETRRAEIKKSSREVGALKKEGKDASHIMKMVADLKKEIEDKEESLNSVESELSYLLSTIPNFLADDVPEGTTEDDNKMIMEWGKPKDFSFKAKDHIELGETLDMLDFEAGAKITGARFVVLKSDLARMERALINYMLDGHLEQGYTEMVPPFIVNEDTLFGTGQLPKFADDLFKIDDERNWYLIPTAEVPLTNMKKKELFSKDELPLKYCAYTPCFRSEAGSYGKDTRGLIRLHQFNKIEMVNIVAADKSEEAHEAMVRRACQILEDLKLPYRGMLLCGGDIGFGARRCIDLEVWLPGQGKYREISSVSNCWDFQARRAGIRYRGEDGKPQFAHTLNGSGLAVGRTLLAIMENYQLEDGSIEVPEVLRGYMGGQEKIAKKA